MLQIGQLNDLGVGAIFEFLRGNFNVEEGNDGELIDKERNGIAGVDGVPV
jgi:hypothetical protein